MTWQAPTQSDLAFLEGAAPISMVDGTHRDLAIAYALDAARTSTSISELPAAWFENAGRLLLDAALKRDSSAISELQEAFRALYLRLSVEIEDGSGASASMLQERKGRLDQLGDLARVAAERVFPTTAAARVEPGSHLERFLLVVSAMPRSSGREIRADIKKRWSKDLDEAVVSKLGHKAVSLGLVDVVRTGRRNSWELTPRGEKTCDILRDRQADHERWEPVVLYTADDDLSMSAAITNSGQPERMGVMSSQSEPILYERMEEVNSEEVPTASLQEEWTVGQVASAGPAGAPAIVPSDGKLYEKVSAKG